MLQTLITQTPQANTWQKIPWHDPDFSRRMLQEHLNQSHNRASRPQTVVEADVQWIQRKILGDSPAKILDLGCGPGFYSSPFAQLGHTVTGIDFSPASIDYARQNDPHSDYHLADIREYDFGEGYDLIMMIHGELNAFSPDEAQHIIQKARAALKPNGKLLLEVHHHECVRRIGKQAPSWFRAERGLFSDEPYLSLVEFDFSQGRTVTQFHIVTQSEAMTHYVTMLQGYSEDEYRHLLRNFSQVMVYPMMASDTSIDDLFVIVATR